MHPVGTPPTGRASALRVLVAEDNPVNQRVITLTLGRLGYRPDVVADGAEALDALRRATYDLVLMDLRMPHVDGLEATRRLRADGTIHQPRVVAMTADVTADKRDACLAAGMDAFLGKPVDVVALADVIDRMARAPAEASPIDDTGNGHCERDVAFPALWDQAPERDVYRSLLDDARRSLNAEVEATKAALQQDRLEDAARAAHTAKGVGGLLGDAVVERHAKRVQDACDDARPAVAVRHLVRLVAAAHDLGCRADAELALSRSPVAA